MITSLTTSLILPANYRSNHPLINNSSRTNTCQHLVQPGSTKKSPHHHKSTPIGPIITVLFDPKPITVVSLLPELHEKKNKKAFHFFPFHPFATPSSIFNRELRGNNRTEILSRASITPTSARNLDCFFVVAHPPPNWINN